MKVIDAEAGFKIFDDLFDKIESNGYVATPEMLEEACTKYNSLSACCDIDQISMLVDGLVKICSDAIC